MVPGHKFDQPGKSPFMDMDLVPVYADEVGDGGVRISPAMSQNLGIRLGTVEKAELRPQLHAVGNITFDERLLEVVQARVTGYVTRLYVKAPLERVRRGQPLAEILAPEWVAAQQEYLALMMAALPFALIGGFWFIYLLGHEVSVATAVGFIALAGVAAEFSALPRRWSAA